MTFTPKSIIKTPGVMAQWYSLSERLGPKKRFWVQTHWCATWWKPCLDLCHSAWLCGCQVLVSWLCCCVPKKKKQKKKKKSYTRENLIIKMDPTHDGLFSDNDYQIRYWSFFDFVMLLKWWLSISCWFSQFLQHSKHESKKS